MNVNQHSILVSNSKWELEYEETNSQHPKETPLTRVAYSIGFIAGWPIFFLGGTIFLSMSLFTYAKARWNQHRIINILTNDQCLKQYSSHRVKLCEKQITDLISYAKFLMKRSLKNPDALNISIPQKRIGSGSWDHFSWKQFCETNFLEHCNPNNPDTTTLRKLEEIRIRVNHLANQIHFLETCNDKLGAIREIAKMSFIKNEFHRQQAKRIMTLSAVMCFIPLVIFLESYFERLSTPNDRLIYEGKKHLLPAISSFEGYKDLIEAHNQLVENNRNYITPYIHLSRK